MMFEKELLPSRLRSEVSTVDKVKVGFPVIGNSRQLVLYIGERVARKYGLAEKDRVSFIIYTEDNPFIFRVVKNPEGWKIGRVGKTLKVQIPWHYKIPSNSPELSKFAHEELVDGCFQVSLQEGLKLLKQEE